jgi:hypothetical protein
LYAVTRSHARGKCGKGISGSNLLKWLQPVFEKLEFTSKEIVNAGKNWISTLLESHD